MAAQHPHLPRGPTKGHKMVLLSAASRASVHSSVSLRVCVCAPLYTVCMHMYCVSVDVCTHTCAWHGVHGGAGTAPPLCAWGSLVLKAKGEPRAHPYVQGGAGGGGREAAALPALVLSGCAPSGGGQERLSCPGIPRVGR